MVESIGLPPMSQRATEKEIKCKLLEDETNFHSKQLALGAENSISHHATQVYWKKCVLIVNKNTTRPSPYTRQDARKSGPTHGKGSFTERPNVW